MGSEMCIRDRLGYPGKYTFCFAEREIDSQWESFAVERGFSSQASTVSLFAASGVQPVMDQASRHPESLTRSFAACLKVDGHPKHANAPTPVLVISPEHSRRYDEAGWSKVCLQHRLAQLLEMPIQELKAGADGIVEGISPGRVEAPQTRSKFSSGSPYIIRAGGDAGLFSAIISSWGGSKSVTREIIK